MVGLKGKSKSLISSSISKNNERERERERESKIAKKIAKFLNFRKKLIDEKSLLKEKVMV